ncbi:hypothetical protein ACE6H2_028569 [Prunus campanulata]
MQKNFPQGQRGGKFRKFRMNLQDRYFQEGEEVKMNITVENAYRRSIETVVDWIGSEVNTSKTYVLFRTYAPVHFSKLAVDVTEVAIWNSGGGCHMEALPDLGSLPVLPHSPIVMTIFYVLSIGATE